MLSFLRCNRKTTKCHPVTTNHLCHLVVCCILVRFGPVVSFIPASKYRPIVRSTSSLVLRETNLSGDLGNDPFDSLTKRIQELRDEEAKKQDSIARGLSNRVSELASSERTQNLIENESQIELPVISFDALLPRQILEGRTEDPTFCRFLRDSGLGGWFVMTSLSPKTRKLRRHGVIAKIEAVDSIAGASVVGIDQIPTAVDFCIVGHRRCRLVGPRKNMQQRIGRWRRGYDPDCEESVLGWGPERFVDAPDELEMVEVDGETAETFMLEQTKLKCTEWSSLIVECNLDQVDANEDPASLLNKNIAEKFESLIPRVEEWYELAANVETYNNNNVTASTRIRRGEPGLWVDPQALLQQVRNSIGPRPEDPTAFCFWAAALINPLPVLGASLEIRGQLLEAPTLEKRLQILEFGLVRSIDNLKGKRPL